MHESDSCYNGGVKEAIPNKSPRQHGPFDYDVFANIRIRVDDVLKVGTGIDILIGHRPQRATIFTAAMLDHELAQAFLARQKSDIYHRPLRYGVVTNE